MGNTSPAAGNAAAAILGAADNSPDARAVWSALRRADRIAVAIQYQMRHGWGVNFTVLEAGQRLLEDGKRMGLAAICLEPLEKAVREAVQMEEAADRAAAAKCRQVEECCAARAARRVHLPHEGEARGRTPYHRPDFRQPWYDGDTTPF